MTKARRFVLLMAASALLAAPFCAAAAVNPSASPENSQEGRNYARVGAIEGGLYGFAPGDKEPSLMLVNAPVYPGMFLVTEAQSRAALVLADGSEFFLDESSALEVVDLGDPAASVAAVFSLEKGGVLLHKASGKGEIAVRSGEGSMHAAKAGLYRVDALPSGGVRVSVLEGTAKVSSGADSRYLDAGERLAFEPFGSLDAAPEKFRGKDALYLWARNQGYAVPYYEADMEARRAVAGYGLPPEAARYAADFSRYGTWEYYPAYGCHVWVPEPLYAGWRPYSWGHWCATPAGYYWVGYEPFGWYPYRYGRWMWTVDFGWCWVPGRLYAPAWVSWTYHDGYVGWCPMGLYGRPATSFIGISWYGGYWSGWSFALAGDLFWLGYYGGACYPYSSVAFYVPSTVNVYNDYTHITKVVHKYKNEGPRPPLPSPPPGGRPYRPDAKGKPMPGHGPKADPAHETGRDPVHHAAIVPKKEKEPEAKPMPGPEPRTREMIDRISGRRPGGGGPDAAASSPNTGSGRDAGIRPHQPMPRYDFRQDLKGNGPRAVSRPAPGGRFPEAMFGAAREGASSAPRPQMMIRENFRGLDELLRQMGGAAGRDIMSPRGDGPRGERMPDIRERLDSRSLKATKEKGKKD
jgi:hypothetical protein